MGSALSTVFVDTDHLPETAGGGVQIAFLFFCYSYILAQAGSLLKEGSELLLLVPSVAGIVGSVILPVLGGVPDGAIVLFSGMSNDPQRQINVGIGALAGSTVLMLTSLFALATYAGRVDLDSSGHGTYRRPAHILPNPKDHHNTWKLTKGFFETGCNCRASVQRAALWMLITQISMFIIQIPACFARCSLEDETSDCKTPKAAAIVAAVSSFVLFFAYLYVSLKSSKEEDEKDNRVEQLIRIVQERSLAQRIISASVMFELDKELPLHHHHHYLHARSQSFGSLNNTNNTNNNNQHQRTLSGTVTTSLDDSTNLQRQTSSDEIVEGETNNNNANIANAASSAAVAEQTSEKRRKSSVRITLPKNIHPLKKQNFSQQNNNLNNNDGKSDHASPDSNRSGAEPTEPLLSPVFYGQKRFEKLVRKIFKRYDVDKSGSLEPPEIALLLRDLGEAHDPKSVRECIARTDRDGDQVLSLDEFVTIMIEAKQKEEFMLSAESSSALSPRFDHRVPSPDQHAAAASSTSNVDNSSMRTISKDEQEGLGANNINTDQSTEVTVPSSSSRGQNNNKNADVNDSSSSDEEAEVPDDLADLAPDVQRSRIIFRACWQLIIGTILVCIFSDPLVGSLDTISKRLDLPPFYVSFVVAPLVTSSPELIASWSYASKKTITSSTISFSTLVGTVSMNNTFCLFIFLVLVVVKDLKWVFTAEIASMIFVELMMFGMLYYQKTVITTRAGIIFAFTLFPLSLALVALTHYGGLD